MPDKPWIDPETGLIAVYGGAEAFEGEAFEADDFEAASPQNAEGDPLPFDFFVG
jgi:hypothetical protein